MDFFSIKIIKLILISFFFLSPPLFAEKYALLIGSNYKGNSPIADLELCEKDVKKMQSQILKTGNFNPKNVKTLLGPQVTRANIRKALLTWLAKEVEKNDQVFFFFAGHGTFFRDESAKNGMRNYLVMFQGNHISDKELSNWFKKVKTQKSVIILDCCFSGGIAKKGAKTRGEGKIPIPKGSDAVILQNIDNFYFQNKVVIASADQNETAIELGTPIDHGIFTYYFSDAILKGDLNNDKKISAYEAFFKARNQTKKRASSLKHRQTPQISGDASNFFFIDSHKILASKKVKTQSIPSKISKKNSISQISPLKKLIQKGNLVLDTTYRQKNLKGKELAIYVDKKKFAHQIEWNKNPHWGKVARIKISNIETGVRNITIDANGYPRQSLKTGIEKNQTTCENLFISPKGRGSINGQIWLGNFSTPVPNLLVFLKPIRIPKQPAVRSNSKGIFVFSELKPGKYEVFVRGGLSVFSKPYNRKINVEANKVTRIDIVLKEYFKK